MNQIHVHWLPDGRTHPPCGVGTGKMRLAEYDVTSVPSKVTCDHCLDKMKEKR